MNIASFPNPEGRSSRITEMVRNESYDWAKVAACGSLVAGGLLLLTGQACRVGDGSIRNRDRADGSRGDTAALVGGAPRLCRSCAVDV
jgi:hypothetical protein